MKLFVLFCYLCAFFLDDSVAYKAGVLHIDKELSTKEYAPFVYEAHKEKVDIFVLPSPELKESIENFDESVKLLSNVARKAGLYVVATLYKKTSCRNAIETVKASLVFNRNGAIISDYRKSISNLANCTSSPSQLVTFTTDFGVTFGLLMDEDIVVHDVEHMKGLKNFVMSVANREDTILNGLGAKLSPAWSYVNNVNLISNKGIFIGKSGLRTGSSRLVTADIDGIGSETSAVPIVQPIRFSTEDLSQYIMKPLDLKASIQGYKETVCHESFCCKFFVKTGDMGLKSDVSYNLVVLDGVHSLVGHRNIGVQNCAVVACVDEKYNGLRTTNNTNIIFERISIFGNFTKQNIQYPIIQASKMPAENFKFETNSNDFKQVTLEIVDGQNVLNFGIFGRDFSKDFDSYGVQSNNSESTYDIYDLIFNEDVQEFFDYVWIRLRILIVIVSIYVLEML